MAISLVTPFLPSSSQYVYYFNQLINVFIVIVIRLGKITLAGFLAVARVRTLYGHSKWLTFVAHV